MTDTLSYALSSKRFYAVLLLVTAVALVMHVAIQFKFLGTSVEYVPPSTVFLAILGWLVHIGSKLQQKS